MNGKDVDRLEIARCEPDGSFTVLWSRSGHVGTGWNRVMLRLRPGLFRIVVAAFLGKGPYGDIAIDDLAIDDCHSFGMIPFKYVTIIVISTTESYMYV